MGVIQWMYVRMGFSRGWRNRSAYRWVWSCCSSCRGSYTVILKCTLIFQNHWRRNWALPITGIEKSSVRTPKSRCCECPSNTIAPRCLLHYMVQWRAVQCSAELTWLCKEQTIRDLRGKVSRRANLVSLGTLIKLELLFQGLFQNIIKKFRSPSIHDHKMILQ